MDSGPNIDYVYILGASHSGTTLLALLLNAHPEVVTIGETAPGKMGDVDTYRCSCGELIKSCSFWTSIVRRMQERHPDFSLGDFGTRFELPSGRLINRILRCEHRGILLECVRDAALGLSGRWRQSRRAIMARCHDLAAAVLAESGKRVLVDSSKLAHRLKFLLRVPGLNVRVIHLVRDGRGVALTYMRQDEFADCREPSLRRGGRGMAAAPTAACLSMERAAHEWLRSLRSAEHLLARLDRSRWIQVRYEELCRDPEGTLGTIHRFLGTDPRYTLANFRCVDHHVIGNGMRLDAAPEIILDERWREELQDDDLRAFDEVAGEAVARYGYDREI